MVNYGTDSDINVRARRNGIPKSFHKSMRKNTGGRFAADRVLLYLAVFQLMGYSSESPPYPSAPKTALGRVKDSRSLPGRFIPL